MSKGRIWHLAAGAGALVLFGLGTAGPAEAALIQWRVGDHPGGNQAPPTYMLRLGTNATSLNTFTVETPGTGAFFQFDPMGTTIPTDKAKITGTIQHNRNGPGSGGVFSASGPGAGGFYTIEATFTTVKFTDPDATPWYGGNATDKVYDDMLADLLKNSDDTPFNNEEFTANADRIYFKLIEVDLSFDNGNNTYTGPLKWDEFPNGTDKQFFIQKDHRTNPGALAAAGWVEKYKNAGREKTSDFLFTLHPIPEPPSLLLFGVGLLGIGLLHRRRRRPPATPGCA